VGSRGRLLATKDLVPLERGEVADALRQSGLGSSARYGVATYRVSYCTVSPAGAPTTASGLLALPRGKLGRLPLVAYGHGTITARTDAPSFLGTQEARLAPLVFAAEGFAVVAPDYLGLGVSPLQHPFVHAATEADASVDLLRAADLAAARHGARVSHDVLVSGHSQGGHAALAIGRELQRDKGPWRLAALAPMAGPYDMSGTLLPAALDPSRTDPAKASVYLAYLLTSWKSLYHLYQDPHEVFAAPYADSVEGLFDGTHGLDMVAAALPDTPEQLFRPEALARMAHPSGRLAAALRDNDVCRWTPTVPTRLYAGRGDRDVASVHAEQCQRQILDRGGVAQIVDVGEVDHIGTAIASLPLIRAWFSDLTGS
jgi:hypothetical protein